MFIKRLVRAIKTIFLFEKTIYLDRWVEILRGIYCWGSLFYIVYHIFLK